MTSPTLAVVGEVMRMVRAAIVGLTRADASQT
jgi:hypothetical protein